MAATAAGFVADLTNITQAGFVPTMTSGVIRKRVTVGGSGAASNGRFAVFTINTACLVNKAWIVPRTLLSSATNGSIGLVTSEDGSATTLAGEMAMGGTVDVPVYTAPAALPVLVPAASQIVLEVSGNPGAAGVVEVCVDITDALGA